MFISVVINFKQKNAMIVDKLSVNGKKSVAKRAHCLVGYLAVTSRRFCMH